MHWAHTVLLSATQTSLYVGLLGWWWLSRLASTRPHNFLWLIPTLLMIHEPLGPIVDTDSHLIRLQHSHACGRLIILLKTFWLDYYDRFTWVALSIETLRITKFNRKCATTTGLILGQTYNMLLVVMHFRVVMFVPARHSGGPPFRGSAIPGILRSTYDNDQYTHCRCKQERWFLLLHDDYRPPLT